MKDRTEYYKSYHQVYDRQRGADARLGKAIREAADRDPVLRVVVQALVEKQPKLKQ